METIGDRIHMALAARGLKQGEAARIIGISAQYLSDIAAGRKSASKRLKYRIAAALRVSPSWLMDGIGTMEDTSMPELTDLAILTSEIINAPDTSTKRALALAISKMTEKDLEVIDRFIGLYMDIKEKAGQE